MVSKTKTFHWVSRYSSWLSVQVNPYLFCQLGHEPASDPKWSQLAVPPIQHLDDCLDPALNLLNLVSMRLYQMWGTSTLNQHPTLQCVCFLWRSKVSWFLPTQSGAWEAASARHDYAGAEEDRPPHNSGTIWEGASWGASYHAFHLLSLRHIPEKHSNVPCQSAEGIGF